MTRCFPDGPLGRWRNFGNSISWLSWRRWWFNKRWLALWHSFHPEPMLSAEASWQSVDLWKWLISESSSLHCIDLSPAECPAPISLSYTVHFTYRLGDQAISRLPCMLTPHLPLHESIALLDLPSPHRENTQSYVMCTCSPIFPKVTTAVPSQNVALANFFSPLDVDSCPCQICLICQKCCPVGSACAPQVSWIQEIANIVPEPLGG